MTQLFKCFTCTTAVRKADYPIRYSSNKLDRQNGKGERPAVPIHSIELFYLNMTLLTAFRPKNARANTRLKNSIRFTLLTCKTPSQVCMMAFLTGMVPSPDSIFVLNCPRDILFGCLSNVCSVFSCGLNNLLSPHGAVFMYKWKLMSSFSLNLLSESDDRSKIDLLASTV